MRYENQKFTSDVMLDYNEFVNCAFADGATVHYQGGEIKFNGVSFGNVRFAFHDAANRTLSMLRVIQALGPEGTQIVLALIQRAPAAETQRTN